MPKTSSERLPTKVDAVHSAHQLLLKIVRSVAWRPERVAITEIQEGSTCLFLISVAAEDLPRVVGPNGRTARSLRAIVVALAHRAGRRLEVHIQSEEQGRN